VVQERSGRVGRRLMAIMAADVAGYSRLMHDDEEGTPARLTALVAETVEPGGTRGPRGQAYWGWVFG
jgi:adenylate cyclase